VVVLEVGLSLTLLVSAGLADEELLVALREVHWDCSRIMFWWQGFRCRRTVTRRRTR